jgi:uncharacterized protein YggE
MARLEIAVTGNGATTLPAEHATLTLQIQSRPCPTTEEAPKALEHFITQLSETLALYCPKGEKSGQRAAIAHYSIGAGDVLTHHERSAESSGFMSVSSKTPVTKSYVAKADMYVVFADFSALDSLATQFNAMDKVRVQGVQWSLSDASLAASRASSRKEAAKDALQRARDYAEALAGLEPAEAVERVKAVHIKEMEKYEISTRPKLWYGRKMGGNGKSVGAKGKAEMYYEPMDVVVSVKVEGRFVVLEG